MARWTNWLGDHETPASRQVPTTRQGLRRAIEGAVRAGKRIRAVGSGHSHSDAAVPGRGASYVDLGRLDRPLGLETSTLRDGVDAEHLIRVEAGMRIQKLNVEVLPARGLGLLNQGNFDAQTVAGAVSTNTHGTGVQFGGFGDMVLSADIFVVVPDENLEPAVELWRVEPEGGISDPSTVPQMRSSGIDRLVQDDDVFYSMIVSYGTMGIAYSYVLIVRDSYWLSERTRQITLKEFRRAMRDIDGDGVPADVGEHRHVWYVANTVGAQESKLSSFGSLSVHKIWMREVPAESMDDYSLDIHPIWPPMRKRNCELRVKQEIGENIPLLRRPTKKMARPGFDLVVKTVANGVDSNLPKTLPFNHTECRSAYYRVLRRTRDDGIRADPDSNSKVDNTRIVGKPEPSTLAISTEFCTEITRADELINAVCKAVKDAEYLMPAPVGIRFSAPSRHFLTHNAGRTSVYMELPGVIEVWEKLDRLFDSVSGLPIENYSKEEKLAICKRLLTRAINSITADVPGVRLHLGKFHTWKRQDLLERLEHADRWIRIQGLLNAFDTWSNEFTNTLDLKPGSAADARKWLTGEIGNSSELHRVILGALAD